MQVLVFGHSHHPMIANGDRLLICPGRSSDLAQARNSAVTYVMMTIENGNVTDATIRSERWPSNYTKGRRLKANH